MKKWIIFSLFLLLSYHSTYSQCNKFIDTTKNWTICDFSKTSGDPRPPNAMYFYCYFDGDSIYHDTTYIKLMKQRFYYKYMVGSNQLIDDSIYTPELYCLLREDTLSGKVFILRKNYNNGNIYEDLLFDYSLNTGDTLKSILYNYPTVDSISNFQLYNGEFRKIFYMNVFGSSSFPARFYIEGVGGDNGITEPFVGVCLSGFDAWTEIICHRKNLTNLYGNCNIMMNKNEYVSIHPLKFYPNPFSNKVSIIPAYKDNIEHTYQVFNSEGILLYNERHLNNGIVQIDLTFLKKGFYYLVVINQKGEIKAREKIIKL
ncbi:MAG: T9SS type A sorting domain-containing protein [Bacteroidota bacterium]